MRFLIDADTPRVVKEIIESHGYNAILSKDILGFASDDEIFAYAAKKKSIIVTKDLGFAQRFIENKGFGLLLLRLPYYFTAERIGNVIDAFFKEVDASILEGSITIVELGKYRVKKIT